jgi:hypothetical protein
MLRALQRPFVLVVFIVGLVAVAAVASSFAFASSRDPKPQLAEARIIRIAERAAAQAGDPAPTLIQHSAGTRQQANAVASGDRVPEKQWSYLIAERGSFVLKDVPLPAGAPAPRGTVLTLVVDAATGAPTDIGVSNRYPDLAALGQVTTDVRQLPRGCPHRAPSRLPAELWRPARTMLAPAGANSIELCRYRGLNARPRLTIDRLRHVRAPSLITELIHQLDRLPAPPKGAIACPADDGSQLVVLLAYSGGRTVPVSIGLTGCEPVTNGAVVRTAFGFGSPPAFGPQLVRQLKRLLASGGQTPSGP